VNTPESYERRHDGTLQEPAIPADPEQSVEALAIHRDPSLPGTLTTSAPAASRPSVAWVRPSELPTLVGAPWIRRGIDLQSELTRRARRTPQTAATGAGRRITQTKIGRPEVAVPNATTTEGLGL
jgi:hypothetical protein